MSAIYRVRQFARAAGSWVRPAQIDAALVGRYLSSAGMELFRAMPRYDQRHALAVFHTLRAEGQEEPDLLVAALLHDTGKTLHPAGGVHLWHRVATVLLRSLRPELAEQIGQDQPGSWRRPFFVQQHHAAISAELAEQVGCSTRTVELIRRHEEPAGVEDDALLSALKAVDSLS